MTIEELSRYIASNAVMIERLLKFNESLLEEMKTWSEFLTKQALTARIENSREYRKLKTSMGFTNKRITDLEGQHKNSLAYFHEKVFPKKEDLYE